MSMNMRQLLEELDQRAQRRHEYTLYDNRMNAETVCERFEERIKSLEDWRKLLTGALAGIFAWMKLKGS